MIIFVKNIKVFYDKLELVSGNNSIFDIVLFAAIRAA